MNYKKIDLVGMIIAVVVSIIVGIFISIEGESIGVIIAFSFVTAGITWVIFVCFCIVFDFLGD